MLSLVWLWDSTDWGLPESSVHGISPGENTGVGCHFLLHCIFPTRGSNSHLLRLLHWRHSLLLSPLGSTISSWALFKSSVVVAATAIKSRSCVWHFVTLWTGAHQAPLSIGFPRQEYWSGAISFSGGSSQPRDWTQVSCLAGRFLTTELPGKPQTLVESTSKFVVEIKGQI